jgi:hypothetical protein
MEPSTSSTAVLSSTQTTTSGLAATASAAVAAAMAPASTNRALLLAVRFQTVVRYPRSTNVLAIADPMSPRPSTVTPVVVMMFLSLEEQLYGQCREHRPESGPEQVEEGEQPHRGGPDGRWHRITGP